MDPRLDELQRALDRDPALVVIQADRPTRALDAAGACLAGGFGVLAVATTVPGSADVLADLAGRPDVVVGATLVETEDQAREALEAGATFLMAADVSTAVGDAARAAGAVWIPGVMTPNEVRQARDAGARMLHLFPGRTAGGPAHLRLLRDAFPDVEFVVGGGIAVERVGAWLDVGARAVALDDAIYTPAVLLHDDVMQIRNHAAAVHRLVARHARTGKAGA